MPPITTGQPQMQGQQQPPQMGHQPQSPTQPPQQQGEGISPEKMLLQFLKGLEQEIADLGQRLDVLESQSGTPK